MNRFARIQEVLTAQFQPVHLDLVDESHSHSVPIGSESHFKVTIVSSQFENTSALQRRRHVQQLLATEFESGLHALSIQPFTPTEWEKRGGQGNFESPPCASKKT
jgi:BolA protein